MNYIIVITVLANQEIPMVEVAIKVLDTDLENERKKETAVME